RCVRLPARGGDSTWCTFGVLTTLGFVGVLFSSKLLLRCAAPCHPAWSFLEINSSIRCRRWSRDFLRIGATASAGAYGCRVRASVVIRLANHDDAAVNGR